MDWLLMGLATILVPYVLGPLAIKFSMRLPKTLTVTPLAESELAADITPLFAASVNEFAAIGFALNNIYAIGRLANGADGILITYSSPHSRLLASQALLIKQGKVQANYREFIAKQAGVNKYLVVTNSMTVLSFIIPSKINRSVEPDTPIQAHFAATDACVSRLFADGIEDISSERTLAAMAKRLDDENHEKIQCGYLVDHGSHYGFSWKGACIGAYSHLFPLKGMRLKKQLLRVPAR